MFRAALCTVAIGISLVILGAAAAQGDKSEPKPKEVEIGGKTISAWIKILKEHDDPKWRYRSVIALDFSGAASNTALSAILEAAQNDKDTAVRLEAVKVIGRFDPNKVRFAFKALLNALQNDKDGTVREAAATALGNDRYKKSTAEYVPDLAAALKDAHDGTRIAVAGALRNLKDDAKPAIPALLDAAKNPKEHTLVREAAVHIVSRYGKESPRTLPLLIELVKDANNTVALREISLDGLGRSDSDALEVIAALSVTLTDKNLQLRKASATALGTLGVKAKASWPTVKTRVGDAKEDSSVRNHLIRLTGVLGKTNPEAIPLLEAAAKVDDSTENRIAAIQELGEIGPAAKGATATLKMLESQDGRAAVREAASKALKLINP